MQRKKRYIRRFPVLFALILMLAALLISLSACGSGRKDAEAFRAAFIDVGKGDCILLEKDGASILIDAGYEDTADEVLSYLEAQGVGSPDILIITHYDKDHVGGAAQLAAALKPARILLPDYEGSSKFYKRLMETIEENALSAETVSENVSFTLSDVDYTVFASDVVYEMGEDGEEGNDNDVSLVISAVYGEDSYLFVGDIEKKGIKAYLSAGHGEYDVLKIPHHGKYEGNSDEFLESVEPLIAVITDSVDDPAEDKLLNLLEGIDVYRSSESGTIVITSEGQGSYRVTTGS